MKKFILMICTCLLVLAGCDSSGSGKIEYVSIEKAFAMMDEQKTFLLLISRESCSHCEDMKKMLKKELPKQDLVVYNVVMDESSEEGYIEDQLMLEERLDHPAKTPHVYYIDKGVVKDELLGYSEDSPEKFWDWVKTLGLTA